MPVELDPDDPRPVYQKVANHLRAAILTKKFQPGDKLPSQPELAEEYGVARMTVTHALRILQDDGLVVSRQGSGSYVRERTERPVGLRPHIEAAFRQAQVGIDFAGFSGETLHGAMGEPLDKIRAGLLTPESLRVRMLIPDLGAPLTVPSRAGDQPGDDPAVRARAAKITARHAEAVVDAVEELARLGLVPSASAEIRVHGNGPQFKLYVINGEEVFFGYYPVVEHTVSVDGADVPIFDVLGKDTTLFHYVATYDEQDHATQFVQQSRQWFDSMWNTVAKPMTP